MASAPAMPYIAVVWLHEAHLDASSTLGNGVALPAESWLCLVEGWHLYELTPLFPPNKWVNVIIQEKQLSAWCVWVCLISERMVLTERNNHLSRK